ncbi:MAG TPA: hypothetical protein VKA89_01145 [Solirubrobacterales bacterium]|nr:hypothetical protein [Solirubrobacterales bacterium]
MTPNLHLLHAEDHAQDLRARGAASRRVATSAGRLAAPGPSIDDVLIRRADGRDCRALDRLEQLEGRRLGLGGALVAEVGGEVVAAVPLAGGTAVADPFRRTAWLIEMLEQAREGIDESDRAGRPSLAWLRWRRRSSSSTAI